MVQTALTFNGTRKPARTKKRGRPRRDPDRAIHQVNVRFESDLYDAIAQVAVEMGQTMAQTVRQLARVAVTLNGPAQKPPA